ncbi:hypothetical protein K0U00_29485, partial [Paenibacillus sepulcri]|nr:hypothetical protein [Paenibacillus sepulcri]
VEHTPPAVFRKGEAVKLFLSVPEASAEWQIQLHYRHANQVESYQVTDMKREGEQYVASIPEGYTDTPYPIIYFFELRDGSGHAWLSPGFNETLSNQPYYLLRQES